MEIKQISLRNFRNYLDLKLPLQNGVNIFLGENGAGKTNLIEAVEILSTCRSHRTRNDSDIINKEAENTFVSLEFMRHDFTNTVSVALQRRGSKILRVGERKIELKELIGNVKTVLFSPDDLMLIKGAPNIRRSFIDREICQASRIYLDKLMQYNRILKQRNALLKLFKEGGGNMEMLEIYDIELANVAEFIVKKRIEAIEKLSKWANQTVMELSDNKETLEILYEQTHEKLICKEDYIKILKEVRNRDMKRGFTGVGPHLDDLTFVMNGMSLKKFGSQGQQRTVVLAAKLSEVTFIKEQTEEYPILLLDDVLSELDENRRLKLLEFVNVEGLTTFLTATDNSYLPPNIGFIYSVKENNITLES